VTPAAFKAVVGPKGPGWVRFLSASAMMDDPMNELDAANPLRALPAAGTLLTAPAGVALCAEFGRGCVRLCLRQLIDELRQAVRGGDAVPAEDAVLSELRARLIRMARPAGRHAVNATGIILHTGLGRAPLADAAIAAMSAAAGYTPLQASIDTGSRSVREERAEQLICELTGAEAATVVNNNAAATMLVLAVVAAGREVVVSRGQLVEIGGAFRLPDVMTMSGCRLREIGTTNRTHLRDYEAAIGPDTGALLHVHTSNYRVRGFAGTPDIAALTALGKAKGLPVIDDLGSGALLPLAPYGLADEPLVADTVRAGADLCCFSADKLICGPQAGIILGSRAWIARVRAHPFARMFRVCKLTLAALEATLLHFVNGDATTALPFYVALAKPIAAVRADALRLHALLADLPLRAEVADDTAYVGSGSLPDEGLPSVVVRVAPRGISVDELGARLRQCTPAVFARLADRRLVIDCRTLRPGEVEIVAAALRAVTTDLPAAAC
jgi:L-seryl-tRNA(Ser) seleniumtransferase